MDLAEARRHKEFFTAAMSANVRQLSFAGIGAIWVFSGGTASNDVALRIPSSFLIAGLLFVVALAFDFFQYAWASAAWSWFRRSMEHKVQKNEHADSFLAPLGLTFTINTLFWLKAFALVVGYGFLVYSIYERIH